MPRPALLGTLPGAMVASTLSYDGGWLDVYEPSQKIRTMARQALLGTLPRRDDRWYVVVAEYDVSPTVLAKLRSKSKAFAERKIQ